MFPKLGLQALWEETLIGQPGSVGSRPGSSPGLPRGREVVQLAGAWSREKRGRAGGGRRGRVGAVSAW